MRLWVEVDTKQPVYGHGEDPVGRIRAVELDAGTWRALTLRLEVANAIAQEVGLKAGLLSRAVLDLPTDQVAAAGNKLVLAGGLNALSRLAAAQGAVSVEHVRKTTPARSDVHPEPDQEYPEAR
jgi:hypothetical protein